MTEPGVAERRWRVMPSSVIRSFRYDPEARRLRIVFTSGDVYDYDRVPPELVRDFRAAPSKGRFFGPHIRDAFRYRRVIRGGDDYAPGG